MQEGLNERIGKRGLCWQDHCRRIPRERWPSRFLDWEPLRRKRERPRTSWMEGVEEMARRGVQGQEAVLVATSIYTSIE